MSMSSVFVVSNALRLRGFRPSFKKRKNGEDVENISSERGESQNQALPLQNKKDENLSIREEETMEKKMLIEGMMCTHCSGRVEKALNALNGVEAKVDLDGKCAYVKINGDVTDKELTDAVTEAGYEVKGIE